jgi:uncharacterized protein
MLNAIRYSSVLLLLLLVKPFLAMEKPDANPTRQLLSVLNSEVRITSGKNPTLEEVNNLLRSGADVNAHDADGFTPLIHEIVTSTYGFNAEIAQALCSAGARLDRADHDGNTPLHWAINADNQEGIFLLLKLGASFMQCNNAKASPIGLIERSGSSGPAYDLLLNRYAEHKRLEEVAQQQEDERLRRRQRRLTLEEVERQRNIMGGKALKCTDAYIPDYFVRQEAKGIQSALERIEYIQGAPYYPKDYYYVFWRKTFFRAPATDGVSEDDLHKFVPESASVGQITVFTPSGDPDPAIIKQPFGIISGLMVNQESQRQGHASRLLRYACAYIKDCNFSRAVLNVEKGAENQTAISLYTKEGFVRDETQEGYVMTKTL